ncbi:hypothetical protein Pint_24493 [Pistacia integerrima]|uniref:Uncharacterized protein n=1 Tax=Pistacia integerrima TaxID=434235 RepID=A0ACC0YI16_9ROSI|nr:hypothetical protein Pint_24493 [Pistacia integerrima]
MFRNRLGIRNIQRVTKNAVPRRRQGHQRGSARLEKATLGVYAPRLGNPRSSDFPEPAKYFLRCSEATRKGFYLYDDKGKARPDPELKKYIEKARSVSSVAIDPKFSKLSEKDIVEMIFFSVVNEAYQVFAEGIAVKAADLDVAAVMGEESCFGRTL